MIGLFPRWLIVTVVLVVGLYEIAVHLPDVLLSRDRYEAQRAEYRGKYLPAPALDPKAPDPLLDRVLEGAAPHPDDNLRKVLGASEQDKK